MKGLSIVSGTYVMTEAWEVALPGLFQKAFEGEDLVLSREGLKVWVGVWGNDAGLSAEERLSCFREEAGERTREGTSVDGDVVRGWWFSEDEDGDPIFDGFVFDPSGHVQLSASYDAPEAEAALLALVRGVRPHHPH